MRMITFTLALVLSMGVHADDAMTMGMVEATGLGTVDMSKVRNKIQGKILAKRAAVVDAQRNLLEMVEGVRVTSGTTVKDAQLESDLIANRVKGLLKGAFTVEENIMEEDGEFLAEVKMAICLSATLTQCKTRPNLGQIVYASLEKPEPEQVFEPAPEVVEEAPAPASPEPYTGVVVDLTSQDFSPYYDVRMVTNQGKEVYGPGHFDPSAGGDWLHWSKSVATAQGNAGVVGANPLVIAASGTTEDSNIILSDDDAMAVFQANLKNDFLSQGKVIFVVK